MPNAFATGRNPKNAAVVATRPLLNLLTDDELEGVIAHELSHVKNRDILVMSVASTMSALITYVAKCARKGHRLPCESGAGFVGEILPVPAIDGLPLGELVHLREGGSADYLLPGPVLPLQNDG